MKLNIDCVRDVLLEFEEFPMGNYNVSSFAKTVGKYGHENTLYTLAKLYEANYINGDIAADEGGYYHCLVIYDITFQGHEFLSTIRERFDFQYPIENTDRNKEKRQIPKR